VSRRAGFLPLITLACTSLCGWAQAQEDVSIPEGSTEGRSIFTKAADWIERNPLALRRNLAAGGIFPSLGGFAQNTGVSPGLTMVQPSIGGSGIGIMFSTARSFRGDEFGELRVGRLPYAPSRPPSRQQTLEALTPAFAAGAPQRFFAYAELRRRDLEGGELFDDQGGSTPYQLDDATVDLVVGWHPTPHWLAAMRAGTLSADAQLELAGNDLLASLSRKDGRDRYFRTSAAIAFDDRDHPRNPHRGSFAELSLSRYAAREGDVGGFDRIGFEARHFQPLGSERRVLALRASATLDSGGNDVPFYLMDSLGGGERLRSYQAFRFRGPRLWSITAEYRHELARMFEGVVFYDAGKVWGGNDAMATSGLLGSYGAGVRVKSSEGVLLRFEAARGSEGSRLNVKLGYEF
jgi:hypothetical protein